MNTSNILINNQYEKVPISEKEKEAENEEIPSYGYGVRHVQALLIFVCLTINFIGRAHLGVAIVAMVDLPTDNNTTFTNSTNITDEDRNITVSVANDSSSNGLDTALLFDKYNLTINNESTIKIENKAENTWSVYRTYNWPKSTQEVVLGSFFLGYLLMTFPLGLVCQRWGGKLPLQISLLVNCIVSILTPWSAVWGGWKAVCLCRVLQGLSQSGVYPGVVNLMAHWAPLCERGRLTTYVLTGTVVGTVVAFQVGGVLAASPWGWPSIFWMTGLLCGLALCLLTVFGAATPAQHKFITEEEKRFISGEIQRDRQAKKRKTPWKGILTSRYYYAALLAHIGSGTSFVFFLNQVPSYLHYILGVDVKKSGLFSSLPYIANFFASIALSSLSDFLTNRKILSLKNARRICNSIGSIGIAASMAAVSFTHSTPLAVACLILGLGSHSGIHTGWMVNYIDLAPNFSGTLMATGNTFMNIFILITPMLVSYIVTDVTNPFQWRIVLFLVASLSFLTNLMFVLFMTSDVQPWNDDDYDTTDQGDKEMQILKQPNDKK